MVKEAEADTPPTNRRPGRNILFFVRSFKTRDQAEDLLDSKASESVDDHHETNEDRSKQGFSRNGDGQSDRRQTADVTSGASY